MHLLIWEKFLLNLSFKDSLLDVSELFDKFDSLLDVSELFEKVDSLFESSLIFDDLNKRLFVR